MGCLVKECVEVGRREEDGEGPLGKAGQALMLGVIYLMSWAGPCRRQALSLTAKYVTSAPTTTPLPGIPGL